MFIYTAKFNKKKALILILAAIVVLVAIILLVSKNGADNSAEAARLSAIVKNNDQRVAYLNSMGWEVSAQPLDEQKVVIPKQFSDVYKKYNELQQSQGFDLKKFGGIEATRYTYMVTNYPGSAEHVVADMIVYRDEVIAGDVQSTVVNGFMQGLEKTSASLVKTTNTPAATIAPSPAKASGAPASPAATQGAKATAAPASAAASPSAKVTSPQPSAAKATAAPTAKKN